MPKEDLRWDDEIIKSSAKWKAPCGNLWRRCILLFLCTGPYSRQSCHEICLDTSNNKSIPPQVKPPKASPFHSIAIFRHRNRSHPQKAYDYEILWQFQDLQALRNVILWPHAIFTRLFWKNLTKTFFGGETLSVIWGILPCDPAASCTAPNTVARVMFPGDLGWEITRKKKYPRTRERINSLNLQPKVRRRDGSPLPLNFRIPTQHFDFFISEKILRIVLRISWNVVEHKCPNCGRDDFHHQPRLVFL